MRLRERREQKNLTLQEVSEAIDYEVSSLSRVERGRQTLTLAIAKKLATYYGVTIDELILDEDVNT